MATNNDNRNALEDEDARAFMYVHLCTAATTLLRLLRSRGHGVHQTYNGKPIFSCLDLETKTNNMDGLHA